MNALTSFLPPTEILLALALGAVVFYIFEYLSKRKLSDFKFGFWIKDNWYKMLILAPLCLIIDVKYIDPGITEQSAFWIGVGVSGIIDRVQDLIVKK